MFRITGADRPSKRDNAVMQAARGNDRNLIEDAL
jgi:hypothetical protein